MASILVIEDESLHSQMLHEYLTEVGHTVSQAGSAEQAWDLAAVQTFDLILLDIRLPGVDGLSAIDRLRQLNPDIPIIVMTAFGTLENATASVRSGVRDYLVKPFSLKDLNGALNRVLDKRPIDRDDSGLVPENSQAELVIGRSPAMQRIFNEIALVASSDIPVLLTGESGTGKEVLARAIHRYSSRNQQRFLPVFLAALSPGLVESELFGHAKGAFTGATLHRPGLLEQASGGTVLLDELGDISLALQVKLLRAIEQKEITRVGEDIARPVNVRYIAATNKPLLELIDKQLFREDLFYRLSVYHIELPPLRERREDIRELAEYFLKRISATNPSPGFTTSAIQELESRPWMGNIRELRNAVEHAAVASRGAWISDGHLPRARKSGIPLNSTSVQHRLTPLIGEWLDEQMKSIDPLIDEAQIHAKFVENVELDLIQMVLKRCQNNQTAAARVLGLDRKTLRTKMRIPGNGASQ